jgi:hypothetical protein
LNKFTKLNDYENVNNKPYKIRLRADGPRMGLMFFKGLASEIMTEKKLQWWL